MLFKKLCLKSCVLLKSLAKVALFKKGKIAKAVLFLKSLAKAMFFLLKAALFN